MPSWKKKSLCLLPPAAGLAALVFRDRITQAAAHFQVCDFRRITGFLCPGCGNTRSVLALLQLDILSALRYNIVPVIAAVLALGFYAELVLWAFGRPHRIVPRRPWFWWPLGILCAVYFIARNIFPVLTCAWQV